MKRITLLTAFTITFLLLLSIVLTAQASGQRQVTQFATPTPGPDGRIIWIVQAGQTCSYISLLTGVPQDQLRALNRLDQNCTLSVGQQLLIGIGAGSNGTAIAGPTLTPTAVTVPPTPIPGSIDVCVLLYDDLNGDSLHQDAEPAIEGGAVSIAGTSGQYSQTSTTVAGTDPVCFTKVPLGTYNVSVAAPAGYNATTSLNYALEIKEGDVKVGDIQAGDRVYVDFGAQKSSQPPANNSSSAGSDNWLLGIIGAVLLLTGGGLAFYAWRIYGRRPGYMAPRPPMPK